MTSCEEAKLLCDKAQYEEASWWETIKLKMHLLYCKACASHSEKNTKFTGLCNKASLQNLSDADKEEMKEKIDGLL